MAPATPLLEAWASFPLLGLGHPICEMCKRPSVSALESKSPMKGDKLVLPLCSSAAERKRMMG